jgi:hypothetical protein
MSQLDVRASFHKSEKGKEVSAGKGDFVEIHGIDLWQEGGISVITTACGAGTNKI